MILNLKKQLLSPWLLLMLTLFALPQLTVSSPYLTDYQEALKKAGEENKELLIDFYTDW